MPVPVFCCFWFQKGCSGNILGIGRNKSPGSYFSRKVPQVRRGDEDGPGGPHTIPGRGPPLGRAARWGPHLGTPPTSPLRLYMLPDVKTLKQWTKLQKDSRDAAAIAKLRFGGQKSLFRHAAGTGKCPRNPSPTTPSPSTSRLLTPMMRRE